MINIDRKLDGVWFGLLLATAFTWWLGESGAAGTLAVTAMMAVAGIKGIFVALDFMALRRVRRFWQGLVIGWLIVVLGFIGLAYRIGLHGKKPQPVLSWVKADRGLEVENSLHSLLEPPPCHFRSMKPPETKYPCSNTPGKIAFPS